MKCERLSCTANVIVTLFWIAFWIVGSILHSRDYVNSLCAQPEDLNRYIVKISLATKVIVAKVRVHRVILE